MQSTVQSTQAVYKVRLVKEGLGPQMSVRSPIGPWRVDQYRAHHGAERGPAGIGRRR